jgi:FkbM family methyltransferase
MRNALNAIKNALPVSIKNAYRNSVGAIRTARFKPYIKRKHIEGVAFDFWICDLEARDWYDIQCTDPIWVEMRFIRDHLVKKGDVILECGGHHGCTGILLSNWVGEGGKVVTFEPFSRNCEAIKRNLQLNNIRNIVLEEKAVGAVSGKIYIDGTSNSSVVLTPGRADIETDIVNLDRYEHLQPSLLKIDVEGFEVEVLRGARRILSKRPKLAIEIHTEILSHYGSSIEELFSLIHASQYKLWIQWEDGTQPEEYNTNTSITKRVHLFGMPMTQPAC